MIAIGTRVYVRERSQRYPDAFPGEHIIIAGPRTVSCDDGNDSWTEYVGCPCYPEDELFNSTGSSAQNILRSIDADTIDMIEDERKREVTDEMVKVGTDAGLSIWIPGPHYVDSCCNDGMKVLVRAVLKAALEVTHE